MADRRREPQRGVPKRALIGPLVMLAGGAAATAALWRFLMLSPAPGGALTEHITTADRRALDDVLRHGAPH